MIKKSARFPFWISFLVLTLVGLPVLLAGYLGTEAQVFAGFLFNPVDGNSYLAKMYQGWSGAWRFQLPFTAQPGPGAYLFLFYLGLGHLARVLGLSLVLVFHLARLLASLFLLWRLWLYCGALFPDQPQRRKLAYALAALGSGLGWLVLPLGWFTSDFWVAEAYPFLSAYANPHFPLGLGLLLWLIIPDANPGRTWWPILRTLGLALLLAIANPFGIVLSLMILAGQSAWLLLQNWRDWAARRPDGWARAWAGIWPAIDWRLWWVALAGLPVLLYDIWVTRVDPVFGSWDAQNLTPSPGVGDLLIAFSPLIWLAFLAGWRWSKRQPGSDARWQDRYGAPLIWLGLGLILLYLPFSLQRRFLMGLYIPLAALAAIPLGDWLARARRPRVGLALLFLLIWPTNLIVILVGLGSAANLDARIYLDRAEVAAFDWIELNTPERALILAAPQTSLFLPGHTGRRVTSGHPFETVEAQAAANLALQFFSGEMPAGQARAYLEAWKVDYLFWGPREKDLGTPSLGHDLRIVYSTADVTIYQFSP